MKTLIAYSTKHGSTEKSAHQVREKLQGDVTLVNVKKEAANLNAFDRVIVGFSVYAGHTQKEMKAFLTEHKDVLVQKNLAFFINCAGEKEAIDQMEKNVPAELFASAIAKVHVGHEINFDDMNFLERFVYKKVSKQSNSYSDLRSEGVETLAGAMNVIQK